MIPALITLCHGVKMTPPLWCGDPLSSQEISCPTTSSTTTSQALWGSSTPMWVHTSQKISHFFLFVMFFCLKLNSTFNFLFFFFWLAWYFSLKYWKVSFCFFFSDPSCRNFMSICAGFWFLASSLALQFWCLFLSYWSLGWVYMGLSALNSSLFQVLTKDSLL